MSKEVNSDAVRLLRVIASGEDCGKEIAANLVGAMLKEFPDCDDDERFEHLMYMLAMYEPDEGMSADSLYYYGSDQLAEECRRVLAILSQSG